MRLPLTLDWDIISDMNEPNANALCRSCGLCCNGGLFAWVKLRPAELNPIEELGVKVFRSDPNQRGFSQPCPLWKGECTIYNSAQYPHACRAYNCKLLKEVIAEKISLPHALIVVKQAKGMIHEVESLLPASTNADFRERLVEQMEGGNTDPEFQIKANTLLKFYEEMFGVKDLVDMRDQS
jgi:hypothetical protein